MNRRQIMIGGMVSSLGGTSVLGRAQRGRPPASGGFMEGLVARRVAAGVPAVTAGFVHRGRLWAKGLGTADLENDAPATASTTYRFASVQKSMTATAVLTLAEAGRLDLDADIRRYVPYFPAKPWPVTARQLLGQQGGI